MTDAHARPVGRESVTQALIDATIQLVIEQGTAVSVREIAARADVNHGLVHTYFGSKDALIAAAMDEVQHRAADDIDDEGFPNPHLANHRQGELAKVIARMRLDENRDLFTSHPVSKTWTEALLRADPELDHIEARAMVAMASAVGLGWAVFADHVVDTLDLSDEERATLDDRIAALVIQLGGLPVL